jgi:hypothetical protein
MKTAVEWLVQELHDNGYFHEGVPEDIVKKAKEMEEQEKVEFAFKAYSEMLSSGKSFVDIVDNMRTFK